MEYLKTYEAFNLLKPSSYKMLFKKGNFLNKFLNKELFGDIKYFYFLPAKDCIAVATKNYKNEKHFIFAIDPKNGEILTHSEYQRWAGIPFSDEKRKLKTEEKSKISKKEIDKFKSIIDQNNNRVNEILDISYELSDIGFNTSIVENDPRENYFVIRLDRKSNQNYKVSFILSELDEFLYKAKSIYNFDLDPEYKSIDSEGYAIEAIRGSSIEFKYSILIKKNINDNEFRKIASEDDLLYGSYPIFITFKK